MKITPCEQPFQPYSQNFRTAYGVFSLYNSDAGHKKKFNMLFYKPCGFQDSVAIFPLIVYVSGFVTSIVMRPLNKVIGRKVGML